MDGARGRNSNLYQLAVNLMSPDKLKSERLPPPGENKSEHLNSQKELFEFAGPGHLSSPRDQEERQGRSLLQNLNLRGSRSVL